LSMQPIILALVGLAAGLLGSMMGLGGGVIVVPVLSLFLGIPIHQAIAASVVAVIATSTTGAISYVRDRLSNIRLGMAMETFTTVGAILGGLTAALLNRETLSAIFGGVLVLMAGYTIYKQRQKSAPPPPVTDMGLLGGQYFDPHLKREVTYRVKRSWVGLVASFFAGNLSGLLGIGGGAIMVPAMTLAMDVPMKAAAATSNFMIGVTGCASAYIYYTRGMVNPAVAVPVALGVTAGAYIGARVAPKLSSASLTLALAIILLALSVQMVLAAFGISYR
jgi:uncharacterized protein